jgi:CBS domain-containing protein
MSVSDVLKHKGNTVITVRATDGVAHAVHELAIHLIGAVVVEDRWMKPVGILSERDIINAIGRKGAEVLDSDVASLMSSPVRSCRSTDRVEAVMATMTMARIRHVPVIDDGVLKGIVSIGDLVKYRLDEKELEANVLLDLSRIHA